MQVKCIRLKTDPPTDTITDSSSSIRSKHVDDNNGDFSDNDSHINNKNKTTTKPLAKISPCQCAWVIDNALSEDFLELVDNFRCDLPLDAKRPTCKRRFFSSANRQQCPFDIREELVSAIEAAVVSPGHNQTDEDDDDNDEKLIIHVLAYMRFLEYDEIGGRLDPHTDGNKVCEDTGKQSTHTMLLYLRDCDKGGETILFEKGLANTGNRTNNNSRAPPRVVEAVQPLRGRILLFPHPTLHEGSPTVDVPKLCLRAEVSLQLCGM